MSEEPKVVDSPEQEEAGPRCQLLPGGFAGSGPHGSFFESPGWVDRKLAPGISSLEEAVAPPGWWIPLLTGKFLFFSPNLVWLAIALLDYFVFPYDFQAARSFDNLDWVVFRFVMVLLMCPFSTFSAGLLLTSASPLDTLGSGT